MTSAVPPARTHPRRSPSFPPTPPVRTSRGAAPAPLPPSLRHPWLADRPGSARAAPGSPGRGNGNRNSSGLRQREEEREGFPIPGSPELGNSDSCGEKSRATGLRWVLGSTQPVELLLPGWEERAKQKEGGGMPGSSMWRMRPLTLLFTSESDPPVSILRRVQGPTLPLSCIPTKSPQKP